MLWDLAGQNVYRQIHSIFLENVAAALIVFDPTNRLEPLKGVSLLGRTASRQGTVATRRARRRPRRSRGTGAVEQELEQFCQRYGIRGRYVSTSARTCEGLDVLLERIKGADCVG